MSYDYAWSLVAFSVLIAILASYTALRLAGRQAVASGRAWWIAGGGLVMGLGIWAMHFVGMLAVHLPVPVAYDPGLTALSVLPAWAAAAIAFYSLQRQAEPVWARLLASGLMGLGIVAMHYSGMEAMRMSPPIVYDPALFSASLVIAVGASWASLYLLQRMRRADQAGLRARLGSALLMGLAIAGMHYTGMAAASFAPDAVCTVSNDGLSGPVIGLFVGLVTVLVLAGALVLTYFDEVSGENSFYRALLAAQSDAGEGVVVIAAGRIVFANEAMQGLSGYSDAQLKALPAWTALIEGEAPRLPAVAEPGARFAQGPTARQEVALRKADGTGLPCEIVLSGFRHTEGRRDLLVFIDISARKAAEQALRESDAQAQELALVASTTDNAVLILDDRARIIWANAGFTRMSGYTLAEVVGRRPGELLNGPATDPATLDLIRERILRGERFDVEIAHYHKSGRIYWATVDVQPVRDAQGRVLKYISLERDITRTKEVEAALRLSAARLKEAQEIALLGSWELDLLEDHYYLSEVAQRIYEIHCGDQPVSREALAAIMDPDDLTRLRESRQAAIAGGEAYSCLVRLVLPGQRTKYVQIRGSVHADDGVQINRVVGTVQDVTEQKLAEFALQRSEERLREAQQLARVGGFEADLTDPAGSILLSKEAQQIHELYPPDGWVRPAELWARVPPEDREVYQHLREATIASGDHLSAQHRVILPDGRIKHLHIRARVVRDEQGRAVRFLGSVQDITEQKLAEQALREREAKAQELALVAARTDNAVIISDVDGGITWVNEGFTRMTGYTLDEVRGRRPHQLLHGPETDRAVARSIRDRVIRGESVEVEVLHYRKDGRKQWVSVDIQPVRDENGRLAKFISIERDITQGKLAERALRESEARLREAQNLARIGHWELDLARDEYLMSEEALRIHEVDGADGRVPRARIEQLVHPDDWGLLRERRRATTSEHPDFELVLRLMLAAGRMKYVQLRVRVQPGAAGQPPRVSGTIQDVTEQKLAEQALRELNETLEQRVQERTQEANHQRNFIESILATAETLIFVVDHQGRVVRFNRACERLTGYTFEELQGKPFWEYVVTPERRQEARRKHESQRDPSRLPAHLEVEWLTRDGRRRLLSWSNGMITDEQGRLEYMIGTGIDITERKRAEQALLVANESLNRSIDNLRQTQDQLVQSEKLASLGALVAGISHEINTPLGIGVTSATALQEELGLLQRDFQAGTMKRSTLERFINHGLEGSAILVRNLMRAADLIRSFKQVAVDQSSDEVREIDLGQYIDEVVLSLQPKFKGRPIRVVNASPQNLRLQTRPGAIYQILSNLLINALVHAYAPDQPGTIRIEARREGDQVWIEVADDGRGIPPEHRQRIFDPFFTTRRGSGGSGLGLHIVFNLVTSTLKGSIRLVENVDRGTTFRIVFPYSSEQQHEQA